MRQRTPFGKAVQKLRVDGQLSLSEMANILGYSKAFISSTELGTTKPNLNYINKLCDLFCVEPEYFTDLIKQSVYTNKSGTVNIKSKVIKERSKTVSKFLSILNSLDDAKFKELEKFVNSLD